MDPMSVGYSRENHHILRKSLNDENQSAQQGWHEECVDKCRDGQGVVLYACHKDNVLGFGAVLYKASYSPFLQENIPEIHGLNVLPSLRRRGIACELLKAIEKHVADLGFAELGLGVGITSDYQPAFHLYMKEGYLPVDAGCIIRNCRINLFVTATKSVLIQAPAYGSKRK